MALNPSTTTTLANEQDEQDPSPLVTIETESGDMDALVPFSFSSRGGTTPPPPSLFPAWTFLAVSILAKYHVQNWSQMNKIVVPSDDASKLLFAAAFILQRGVSLRSIATHSWRGHNSKKCDFNGCPWYCTWKTNGRGTTKTCTFIDSKVPHSSDCVSTRDNATILTIKKPAVLATIPEFIQYLVENKTDRSLAKVAAHLNHHGYKLEIKQQSFSRVVKDAIAEITRISNRTYTLIPQFYERLCELNQYTVASLQLDNCRRFMRTFLMPGFLNRMLLLGCVVGVIQCDFAHSKTPLYDGVHWFATFTDGDGVNAASAWGLAPTEDAYNTAWFLIQLCKCALDLTQCAIIMDRHPSRAKALNIIADSGYGVLNVKNCLEHWLRNIVFHFSKKVKRWAEFYPRIRAQLGKAQKAPHMNIFFNILLGFINIFPDDPQLSIDFLLYLLQEHPIKWAVFANNPRPEGFEDDYDKFEKVYEMFRYRIVARFFPTEEEALQYWRRYCVLKEPRGMPVAMFGQCRTNRSEGNNFWAKNNGIRTLPPLQAAESFLRNSEKQYLIQKKSADTMADLKNDINKTKNADYCTTGVRMALKARDAMTCWNYDSISFEGNVLYVNLLKVDSTGTVRTRTVVVRKEGRRFQLICPCSYSSQKRGPCPCSTFAVDVLRREAPIVDSRSGNTFCRREDISGIGASVYHSAYQALNKIVCFRGRDRTVPKSVLIADVVSNAVPPAPSLQIHAAALYRDPTKAHRTVKRIRSSGERIGNSSAVGANPRSRATRNRYAAGDNTGTARSISNSVVTKSLVGLDRLGVCVDAGVTETLHPDDKSVAVVLTQRLKGESRHNARQCGHCGDFSHNTKSCKQWLAQSSDYCRTANLASGVYAFHRNRTPTASRQQQQPPPSLIHYQSVDRVHSIAGSADFQVEILKDDDDADTLCASVVQSEEGDENISLCSAVVAPVEYSGSDTEEEGLGDDVFVRPNKRAGDPEGSGSDTEEDDNGILENPFASVLSPARSVPTQPLSTKKRKAKSSPEAPLSKKRKATLSLSSKPDHSDSEESSIFDDPDNMTQPLSTKKRKAECTPEAPLAKKRQATRKATLSLSSKPDHSDSEESSSFNDPDDSGPPTEPFHANDVIEYSKPFPMPGEDRFGIGVVKTIRVRHFDDGEMKITVCVHTDSAMPDVLTTDYPCASVKKVGWMDERGKLHTMPDAESRHMEDLDEFARLLKDEGEHTDTLPLPHTNKVGSLLQQGMEEVEGFWKQRREQSLSQDGLETVGVAVAEDTDEEEVDRFPQNKIVAMLDSCLIEERQRPPYVWSMTRGEERRVDVFLRNADFYYDGMSTRAGESLRPGTFVNDEIINAYMSRIIDNSRPGVRGGNGYLHSGFAQKATSNHKKEFSARRYSKSLCDWGEICCRKWSKCHYGDSLDNIFGLRRLFVPINDGQYHWFLVVADMLERTVTAFNSHSEAPHDGSRKWLHIVWKYLQLESEAREVELEDDWRLIVATNCPQQQSVDCGIFTLVYAEYLAFNKPFNFGQNEVSQMRRRVAATLLSGKAGGFKEWIERY